MFQPLMPAIFRLYMDLSSSYTTDTSCGVFLGVGKGFVWDRDLGCISGGCVVWNSIITYSCIISSYTYDGAHYITLVFLVVYGIYMLSLGCYVHSLCLLIFFNLENCIMVCI